MENKPTQNRREFIAKSILTTAAISVGLNAMSSVEQSRIIGANDKIRVGFIGIGNRGSQLLELFMQNKDVEIAALCDIYEPYLLRDRSKVDPRYLADRASNVPKMGEKFPVQPNLYNDYRKLLEDKSIDAVCIATPDHWHAIMMIDAVKAGKDVYVEKPLTQTIKEGRAMVNASKAANRVVAVGLNRRGNEVYQKLAKEIPVRLAADESAHTDVDAIRRIEMGYKAIALKAIAKTLSMTMKIAQAAHERNIPCFCADLTVNPVLVDWNKNVAARLNAFPGLGSLGLLESNGHQNYRNWSTMMGYHPMQQGSWVKADKGVYNLGSEFYKNSGGIFDPMPHYEEMFNATKK